MQPTKNTYTNTHTDTHTNRSKVGLARSHFKLICGNNCKSVFRIRRVASPCTAVAYAANVCYCRWLINVVVIVIIVVFVLCVPQHTFKKFARTIDMQAAQKVERLGVNRKSGGRDNGGGGGELHFALVVVYSFCCAAAAVFSVASSSSSAIDVVVVIACARFISIFIAVAGLLYYIV